MRDEEIMSTYCQMNGIIGYTMTERMIIGAGRKFW